MDSLHNSYLHEKNDSVKIALLNTMARGYMLLKHRDSSLLYSQEALQLAKKINDAPGQLEAYTYLVRCSWQAGNYYNALDYALSAFHIAENTKDSLAIYDGLRQVCFSYANLKDYPELLAYARRSRNLVQSGIFKDKNELHFRMLSGYINFMGDAFSGLRNMDSALYFRRLGFRLSIDMQRNHDQGMAIAASELGETFFQSNDFDSASFYYKMAIPYAERFGVRIDLAGESHLGIARIYDSKNQVSTALYHAKLAYNTFKSLKLPESELEASILLKELYAKISQPDSAYTYLEKATVLKDSLFNNEKIKAIDSLKYTEALSRQQLIQEGLKHQVQEANMQKNLQIVKLEKTALVRNALAFCLLILLIAGVLFFRNIMLKRKNEKILNEKRHAEMEHQKSELEAQALRAQMDQVLKLQQMRIRIAGDLHDDIGSTLTSISYYSALVKMQLQKDDDSLKPLLDKIGNGARSTVIAMSDIVWIINPNNDITTNLVSRMKYYASEILSERNIQYRFRTNEVIEQIELNMQQRKNIYLIYKEALHNAVKYAQCDKIEIEFTGTDHEISLNINDNGKGFDVQHANGGNGLINMKRRAEEINAHFDICSAQNKGTQIRIKCKIS